MPVTNMNKVYTRARTHTVLLIIKFQPPPPSKQARATSPQPHSPTIESDRTAQKFSFFPLFECLLVVVVPPPPSLSLSLYFQRRKFPRCFKTSFFKSGRIKKKERRGEPTNRRGGKKNKKKLHFSFLSASLNLISFFPQHAPPPPPAVHLPFRRASGSWRRQMRVSASSLLLSPPLDASNFSPVTEVSRSSNSKRY